MTPGARSMIPRDRAFVVTFKSIALREPNRRMTVQAGDIYEAWEQTRLALGSLDAVVSIKPLSEVTS